MTFDIRPWCKKVLDLNSPGPARGPSISDHVVDSLVETYEAVQCGEQLFEDVGDRGGRGGPSISDHVVDSHVETYEAVQCGEQLFEDVGDRGGREGGTFNL